ncbi:MAG: Rpn family recombination-promoting nuclease/putative transposase [Cyanobacteria bacterium P01_H01_bin.74]
MEEQEKQSNGDSTVREQTPHDALVKKAFENRLLAILFFKLVLPKKLAKKINWQTLEPVKDTFVTDRLKRLNLDLLFRVRYYDNTEVCLMLLLEHKSYLPDSDESIDLQLIRYQTAVYTEQEVQHQLANKARKEQGHPTRRLKFNRVIPVVLYHGNRSWNVSSWQEMLSAGGVGEADGLPGLDHSYVLHDLHSKTDAELQSFYREASQLLMLALCLKHSHDKQFIAKLPRLYALAREVTAPEQAVEIIDALGEYLGYLVEPDDYDRVFTITDDFFAFLEESQDCKL